MRSLRWLACLLAAALCPLRAAETFTIATYNVENFLAADVAGRRAKPLEAKAKVAEMLLALRADVVALQEMGNTNVLLELRERLRGGGLEYPHWEHITGRDTNIHVAVLSRFPFTARRPHTNESFLLDGKRFLVSRGFVELDVEVAPRYRFTLIAAHLKSKRPVPDADQAELRENEARLLREALAARLKADPDVNLVVLGDLNDTRDSKAVHAVVGRGKAALVDTRPTERGGVSAPSRIAGYSPHDVAWTYHYGKEDSYTRIDYILLSRGMAREWDREGTFILTVPFWGEASDHRPIAARFFAEDR
ncbi:MAG: endonuclease/exonuclease/phosphatase family protein [Fimbriimonas ginsengisoli]|nr:endonuclease/exonuclease/phosphatase family protein [Fimbriimonas ginsengisoli]